MADVGTGADGQGRGCSPRPHPDDDPEWSAAEKHIADYLRDEAGFRVTAGGRNPDNERHYDFTLNGTAWADGKSPEPGACSGTMRNRARESVARGGQARTLVFDLRGTGASAAEARRGIARIGGMYGPMGTWGHRLDRVIVIGDEFYFEEVL